METNSTNQQLLYDLEPTKGGLMEEIESNIQYSETKNHCVEAESAMLHCHASTVA